MVITGFAPCDFANMTDDGKLNLMGVGWSNLDIDELGASYTVHFVVFLDRDSAEAEPDDLMVRMRDPDGVQTGEHKIAFPAIDSSRWAFEFPLRLRFHKFGRYVIEVSARSGAPMVTPLNIRPEGAPGGVDG